MKVGAPRVHITGIWRHPRPALIRRNSSSSGVAGRGDPEGLEGLLERYRARLRRMIKLRLDRRLQGRVDPSDVIQEAYLEVSRRLAEYLRDPSMPFFLWLRLVTGQKLT